MCKWIVAALLVPFMLLVGCSGSDDNDALASGPTGTASGVAYDGYLTKARVCVDMNLDKACGTGEPRTLTRQGGTFRLTRLTAEQLNMPLVMEATSNTLDSETGGAVDPELKYLAPAGSGSINAYSTIIQMRVEQAVADGSTDSLSALKTRMANELASELGVSVDLTEYDPIAAKNDTSRSSTERRTASQLSLSSKVLSRQIATLVPEANANANGDTTAAFGALVEKLNAQDVMTAVENDTSGLALNELNNTTDTGVVTSETEPSAPTTQEIEEQATEDEAYSSSADFEEDTEPTGATGGTGG